MITATLTSAQGYFAESRRDEALARAAGFAGKTLAIEPIGGGFDLSWFAALRGGEPPSRRSILMVKGYQGDEAGYMVGRALVAIEALHMASASLRQYEIHMYAARDPAVVASVEKLRDGRGIAVHIHPFLPYDALMRLHGRARCSIAISETDGICTSAIEAMLMGSVPIQSDTSCLAEWIAPDAALLVPHDDPEAIAAAVRRAVADDDYMDAAAQSNDVTLRARFAEEVVNPRIVRMYRDAVQLR